MLGRLSCSIKNWKNMPISTCPGSVGSHWKRFFSFPSWPFRNGLKSVTGHVTMLLQVYNGFKRNLTNQNQETVLWVFIKCWGPYIIDFETEPGGRGSFNMGWTLYTPALNASTDLLTSQKAISRAAFDKWVSAHSLRLWKFMGLVCQQKRQV